MKTGCKWLLLAARGVETIHEDIALPFLLTETAGVAKFLFLHFSQLKKLCSPNPPSSAALRFPQKHKEAAICKLLHAYSQTNLQEVAVYIHVL